VNTSNRETILVTGAAGFIGSTLSKSLRTKYNLLLVDDLSYGHIENLKSYDNEIDLELDSELIVADVSDFEGIYTLLKFSKIDYVIHCAAIAPLSDCQNNPNRAMEVNVNGWINVLELSRILGVKKVLLASTNAVYENEEVPVSKVTNVPTLIYPLSKYFAESIAKSYIDSYNMNIVIMRFSNVYGPNMDINRVYPPFVAYVIRELLLNRVPTIYNTGSSRRSYLYSKDLCDIVELLLENVT
jgi:UDP-glucose 4-epimerase